MQHWPPAAIVLSLLVCAGCTPRDEVPAAGPAHPGLQAPAATSAALPGYANKVWKVSESQQVAAGDLRIFLSDGTLVMASDHAKPALGRWAEVNGRLTIIEEGIAYPTDVLELTTSSLRLRMHSAGEPVEMLLTAAPDVARVAVSPAR